MADWGFLGGLFEAMQTHSPLLGRLWLQIMLVFRMLILGTVASDLFEDEQAEFECNTAQPGCKQVCYDQAFPISQYRFWVFHIVLISTPALLFIMYAMHLHSKSQARQEGASSKSGQLGINAHTTEPLMQKPDEGGLNPRQDHNVMRLYMLNVGFRFLAEVAFLVAQWALYGFRVEARFPCSTFPCPYTVDCFTSRPMEKTILLCFYFAVGLLSALFSLAELIHVFTKWRRWRRAARTGGPPDEKTAGRNQRDLQKLTQVAVGDEGGWGFQRGRSGSGGGKRGQFFSGRGRHGGTSGSSSSGGGKVRVSLGRSNSSVGHKTSRYSSQKSRTQVV
ncbi:gap junction delta-3 protein-like [Clupea harengus]|uniref:Gap junction delta-3 protein-like n=1 Tax=Clupea harengus TaxID=7950 RepID=A0A6P8FJI9_CLUHA|nr:gap junction delta-3 protein-like [Clupea harengus]